jgi:hypothetical protein
MTARLPLLTSRVTDQFPLQLISQARYEESHASMSEWIFASPGVHADRFDDTSHHQKTAAE